MCHQSRGSMSSQRANPNRLSKKRCCFRYIGSIRLKNPHIFFSGKIWKLLINVEKKWQVVYKSMPEQINARCSIYSDSIPLRIIRGTGFNFRRTNFELTESPGCLSQGKENRSIKKVIDRSNNVIEVASILSNKDWVISWTVYVNKLLEQCE